MVNTIPIKFSPSNTKSKLLYLELVLQLVGHNFWDIIKTPGGIVSKDGFDLEYLQSICFSSGKVLNGMAQFCPKAGPFFKRLLCKKIFQQNQTKRFESSKETFETKSCPPQFD